MVDTRSEPWKGFDIETRAVPVRHCAMPPDVPDTYVALVRIRRAGRTVADWHLPRYAGRWASAEEAHREAVEYAIKAIRTGYVGEAAPELGLAA
ncbi:hypothetical protein LGN04_29615 [Burkholderia multivorans]|uniref:DUF6566 family protein n=2 Tax=Burkholderia multivorans TaxID=87883 RepID=UPI000D0046C6|nr:DUF6566 family protein [Burkholderia multivorans]MBU9313206.1 hypothetical protein [Burkholderia multivorans]MCA8458058.1 hypothetical protein [Burkholderia multivorans]MDN7873606.1 hypothetical protein [Burkholderia multivorans]PRH24866.1 hypothetical protein C6T53_17065 [Burkholderia multivorans]